MHPCHARCPRLAFALAASRITHLSGTSVIAAPATNILLAQRPAGPQLLHYQSLILATGARELFLPFSGWTTPGSFGAGALQALVKSGLDIRGKRIVVAGTGPLLLAVAALLRASGASVPLIAEQASAASLRAFVFGLPPGKLLGAIAYRAKLLGTRYAVGSYPLKVQADGSSLHITLRVGSRTEQHACDYFACGFGLIPNIELASTLGCKLMADGFVETASGQNTSQPNIYAAGEITGIGGLDKSIIEGRIAALAATPARLPHIWHRHIKNVNPLHGDWPKHLPCAPNCSHWPINRPFCADVKMCRWVPCKVA